MKTNIENQAITPKARAIRDVEQFSTEMREGKVIAYSVVCVYENGEGELEHYTLQGGESIMSSIMLVGGMKILLDRISRFVDDVGMNGIEKIDFEPTGKPN